MKIKIDEILKEHNKTRYWLAKTVNVRYHNIAKICDAERTGITFEMIDKICTALKCTPNDIFETEVVDEVAKNIE